MLQDILEPFFGKLGHGFSKSLCSVLEGVLHSCSSSTGEIARAMSRLNNKPFNTNDKAISYLLSNRKFQIDDRFWRCHLNMVFAMLEEQGTIRKGEQIYIQVDFTSDARDFLILAASIVHKNRAIPLYFSMRNYPLSKNSYDHKKMELAFLKGLKHGLSKKYQYVIVADRGFGNERFIKNCEECGFEYLLRLQPNMSISHNGKNGLMQNIVSECGKFLVHIKKWDKEIEVYRNEQNKKQWYLASNINGLNHSDAVDIYCKRFKIEKCFQDLKSSGFDIESSKIKKYDRFKRLLTICCIASALMLIVGGFVDTHKHKLKKRFPIHINVIIAFLILQNKSFKASLHQLCT